MIKAWRHFKTITNHKILVMKYCFRLGLYKQGLLHDMSKYSFTEFRVGAKYYQGTQSPNNAERMDTGYSMAWLHHKGRNKHHYEFWTDYSLIPGEGIVGMEMPLNYVAEMFADRIAANKIYKKEGYTDQDPWDYYAKGKNQMLIHPKTQALLEQLLKMLADDGEEKTFSYIRHTLLGK